MPHKDLKAQEALAIADREHPRTSTESQLPAWGMTELDGGRLGLTCPRKDCNGKTVVNKDKWLASRPHIGRSCTYCFRTNRIPSKT